MRGVPILIPQTSTKHIEVTGVADSTSYSITSYVESLLEQVLRKYNELVTLYETEPALMVSVPDFGSGSCDEYHKLS